MKARVSLNSVAFAVLVIGLTACGKKAAPADASQPLQQSFQTAEPDVKQAITTATASLKAGNYSEATRALAPVVTARPLNQAQIQAVSVALDQINHAVTSDPKLDTKEMYEMRQKMFQAIRRGPRF